MILLSNVAETTPVDCAPQMFFEPANFISMLYYMGIGMLVIFVIIGIIILSTMVINKMFSKKKNA